jgi:hypothetical protein
MRYRSFFYGLLFLGTVNLKADELYFNNATTGWGHMQSDNLRVQEISNNHQILTLVGIRQPDADLFLPFNEEREWSEFDYKLISGKLNLSRVGRRVGQQAAAFAGNNALVFIPGSSTLFFGSESTGFTIDFWLSPSRLGDGEIVMSYEATMIGRNEQRIRQSIVCYIEGARLIWRFENIFFTYDEQPIIVEINGEMMLKNQWMRHSIRYNPRDNRLEVLDNNIITAIQHVNEQNHQNGDVATLLLYRGTQRRLRVGDFFGYLDNFSIIPKFIVDLFNGYYMAHGVYVSSPIDLFGNRPNNIDLHGITENSSELRIFLRSGSNATILEQSNAPWTPYEVGSDLRNYKFDRFLQVRVDFFAGVSAQTSPLLSNIVMNYDRLPPPPRPGALTFTREGDNVRVSWQSLMLAHVSGYKLYFGENSGDYYGVIGDLRSPIELGLNNSVLLSGLIPGKRYYFSLTAYDANVPKRESAFSAEQVFLP